MPCLELDTAEYHFLAMLFFYTLEFIIPLKSRELQRGDQEHLCAMQSLRSTASHQLSRAKAEELFRVPQGT